jgi:hypothetical protein
MAGASGRNWISSVRLFVRRSSQPSGIVADRSPVEPSYLHLSTSTVTFIGGGKVINSSIVTEFVCDRTIVAVADVRLTRVHSGLRRSRKHEWPLRSAHMAIFRRES